MKIIVLGAGGIGSLVGAFLSRSNDVLLIGRKIHADEINKSGLKIDGIINENFKINADTEIKNIEENALIILTTKAVDNKKSIQDIEDLIKKDTVILSLQNGLGSEDTIKGIVDCKVIRGIITAGTTFLEPGKVTCSNLGKIYIEESEFSEKIINALKQSGLKAETTRDIKKRIWQKQIINCVINPLTTIFKVNNNQLSKVPELIRSIIREITMVAEKEGLEFNIDITYKFVMGIINESGANKSSMLQDIIKSRKTEIDFLNGKVVELAKKHNINVPVNKALTEMIKFLENYQNGTKSAIG